MKVSALVICLNEDDFIYNCLGGIYKYMDEIILVEGSIPYTRWLGLTTVDGGSVDNTHKEIFRFISEVDTLHKIKPFLNCTFDSKIEMRNYALSKCTGDWIMLFDADEFYTEEDLLKIRYRLPKIPDNILGITYPFKQFWSWTLYFTGIVMERVYRHTNDAFYCGNPEDGQNIYINQEKLWGSDRTQHWEDIECYHYSPFLVNKKMHQKFIDKTTYYGARTLKIKTEDEFIKNIENINDQTKQEQARLFDLMITSTQELPYPYLHPVSFKKTGLFRQTFNLYY
jgi:glycosyltransferase involved in cell wall biosynthesis